MRSRDVPRARPKRLLAPSATTRYRARISVVVPSGWRTTTPRTKPRSMIGAIASWPVRRLAPAATARSATSWSSRSRRATRPYVGNTGCDGQSTSTWLPRPVSRIRSMRWNPASASAGTPIAVSSWTARGVRVSPHVFMRGIVRRSRTTTRWPAVASRIAAAAPAGPAPMTIVSTGSGAACGAGGAAVAGTGIGRGHPVPAGEPAAGSVPIGMMPSTDSWSVGRVKSPASRPAKISDSSAHHISNSAAKAAVASAPPSV